MTNEGNRGAEGLKGVAAVNGILGGLGDILGKITELAEKAETLQKDGSFTTKDGKQGRYHVGFNISTLENASGERSFKVEPFGNVTRDEAGRADVSEVREPPTDVFEEDEGVVVVVEMPGVGEAEASFTVEGDVLTVEASGGPKRYRKEVLLPRAFAQDALSISATNGVFEVRLNGRADEAA